MSHVGHEAPAYARVGIVPLREYRRLIEHALQVPELRADADRALADLDHLIEVAEQRAWSL